MKKYKARIVRLDHESCKNRYVFSGRLVCGDCGKHFRRKKVYIGKPNGMVQWSCSKHILDKKACGMKPINECEIHNAFIEMYNKLYTNQGVVLEPFLERLRMLPAKNKAKELERIDIEIDNLTMQYRILNEVMKKGYMDTAIFMQKSNEINHNIAECRKRKIKIFTQHKQKTEIRETEKLINLFKKEKRCMKEFDEKIFDEIVWEIKISCEHDIAFCLRNGMEFTEMCKKKGDVAYAMAYSSRI